MTEKMKNPGKFKNRVDQANIIITAIYDDRRDALNALKELMKDEEGVRAFFVAWLTNSSFDIQNGLILKVIEENLAQCENIIVKNLAMSSAMVVHHGKNKDETLQAQSQNVLDRVCKLIDGLPAGILNEELNQLKSAIKNEKEDGSNPDNNSFSDFLTRWHYDESQLTFIEDVLESRGY